MLSSPEIEEAVVSVETDAFWPCMVLHVSGILNKRNSLQLRDAICKAIDRGCRDVMIECSHVLGHRSVVTDALKEGVQHFGDALGRIALIACPAHVRSEIEVAGHGSLCCFYPNIEQARADFFQTASRVFEPTLGNSALLRSWIRTVTAPLSLPSPDQEGIEASASEAFVNAVEYTSPSKGSIITVRIFIGSSVTIDVVDQGLGFEGRQYLVADPTSLNSDTHGLGIYLMRNLMDYVEFISGESDNSESPAGTTVRLVKMRKVSAPQKRQSKDS